MNLNKFTKAELISKLQNKQNKQVNKDNVTISSLIITNLIYFKTLILKITFIAFLIKYLKKYSLFRRLWLFINWIAMTIFGISILEIYGISFIAAFFTELGSVLANVVNYLANTQIYTTISGLFGAKAVIEKPSSNKSLDRINTMTKGSEEKYRILDWINRQDNRDDKQEIIDETSYKKYLLLLWLLLLAGGLSWYYWGDISPYFPNLPNLFSKKPKPKTDDIDPLDIVLGPKETKSWWDTLKFWKSDKSNIDINKVKDLKAEAANKATSSKDSMDHYFPEQPVEVMTEQLSEQDKFSKMFNQITGENQNNFNLKSEEITGQMNKFLELNKTNDFPSETVRNALYGVITTNLGILSLKYKNLYEKWLNDNPETNNLINKFTNFDAASNQADNQSETYNQVELETIQEQDVWSDRLKSPSIHSQEVWSDHVKSPSVKSEAFNNYAVDETEVIVEKPKVKFTSWLDAINARRDDTNVVDSVPIVKKTKPQSESIILETKDLTNEPYKVYKIDPNEAQDLLKQAKDLRTETTEVRGTLDELIDKSNKLDDSNLISAVKESFDSGSDSSRDHYFPNIDKGKSIDLSNLSQSEIERRASSSKEDTLPEIKVDNTSLEEYFPQPDITETDVNIGFTSMFKDIKSNRLEYGSPKVTQLGLGTSTPIQDSSIVLSPLKTKPSITNLFDDTADLFDIDIDNDNENDTDNEVTENTPAPANSPEEITEANVWLERLPEQLAKQAIENVKEAKSGPGELYREWKNQQDFESSPMLPSAIKGDTYTSEVSGSGSDVLLFKNPSTGLIETIIEHESPSFNDTGSIIRKSSIEELDINNTLKDEIYKQLEVNKLWNKIETDIIDNDNVNLNFHELINQTDSIYFHTDNDRIAIFNKMKNVSLFNQTINWRAYLDNSNNENLKEIFIKDIEGRFHSIYKNDK
jgi:hypothetical protein